MQHKILSLSLPKPGHAWFSAFTFTCACSCLQQKEKQLGIQLISADFSHSKFQASLMGHLFCLQEKERKGWGFRKFVSLSFNYRREVEEQPKSLTVLNCSLPCSLYRSLRNCWASRHDSLKPPQEPAYSLQPPPGLPKPPPCPKELKHRRNLCLDSSPSHALLVTLISKIYIIPTALRECTVA